MYALAFSKTKTDSISWRAFDTIGNTRRAFANTNGWREIARNNGGKYSQYSTLAKGLTLSENIATTSLLESVGVKELIRFADDLGFETEKLS